MPSRHTGRRKGKGKKKSNDKSEYLAPTIMFSSAYRELYPNILCQPEYYLSNNNEKKVNDQLKKCDPGCTASAICFYNIYKDKDVPDCCCYAICKICECKVENSKEEEKHYKQTQHTAYTVKFREPPSFSTSTSIYNFVSKNLKYLNYQQINDELIFYLKTKILPSIKKPAKTRHELLGRYATNLQILYKLLHGAFYYVSIIFSSRNKMRLFRAYLRFYLFFSTNKVSYDVACVRMIDGNWQQLSKFFPIYWDKKMTTYFSKWSLRSNKMRKISIQVQTMQSFMIMVSSFDGLDTMINDIDKRKKYRKPLKHMMKCGNVQCLKTNPTCDCNVNLDDKQLPKKQRMRVCTGCGVMRYCSRKCQKIDWKFRHSGKCKLLKQLKK